jgi:hypothetical protein
MTPKDATPLTAAGEIDLERLAGFWGSDRWCTSLASGMNPADDKTLLAAYVYIFATCARMLIGVW